VGATPRKSGFTAGRPSAERSPGSMHAHRAPRPTGRPSSPVGNGRVGGSSEACHGSYASPNREGRNGADESRLVRSQLFRASIRRGAEHRLDPDHPLGPTGDEGGESGSPGVPFGERTARGWHPRATGHAERRGPAGPTREGRAKTAKVEAIGGVGFAHSKGEETTGRAPSGE